MSCGLIRGNWGFLGLQPSLKSNGEELGGRLCRCGGL